MKGGKGCEGPKGTRFLSHCYWRVTGGGSEVKVDLFGFKNSYKV